MWQAPQQPNGLAMHPQLLNGLSATDAWNCAPGIPDNHLEF